MPRGRHGGQLGIDLAEKSTQQALPGEQVADEVADVAHLDLRRLYRGVCYRRGRHSANMS